MRFNETLPMPMPLGQMAWRQGRPLLWHEVLAMSSSCLVWETLGTMLTVRFCRRNAPILCTVIVESPETTKPHPSNAGVHTARGGQGRPLGFLTAWLQSQFDFRDQASHCHRCRPSYEARCESRSFLLGLEGGQAWSDRVERARKHRCWRGRGATHHPLKIPNLALFLESDRTLAS